MSTTNESSAVGVFPNLEKANRTVNELRRAGFPADEIGVVGQVGDQPTAPTSPETQAPEQNAINGLTWGGVVGAIVGAFVILVIPGVAEIAGMGRWFDVVGGALLGAITCGLIVAFESFGFMRPRSRLIATEMDKGHFVVTVKNSARKEEAWSILRRQGLVVGPNSSN